MAKNVYRCMWCAFQAFSYKIFIIYLARILSVFRPVIFLSSCHICGTLSYSLCFIIYLARILCLSFVLSYSCRPVIFAER
jgi:hypothetical protein